MSGGEGDDTTNTSLTISCAVFNQTTLESGLDHVLIELRLYDNKTGENIPFTTLAIAIYDANDNDTPLFEDRFHTESGKLTLDITSDPDSTTTIAAPREPYLNAAVADATNTVAITTPSVTIDKAYRLHLELLTIDSIRNVLPPETGKLDFYWDEGVAAKSVYSVPEYLPSWALILLFGIVIGCSTLLTRYSGNLFAGVKNPKSSSAL